MFGDFLGRCENHCFVSQTGVATFGATLENLGYFLFQDLVTLIAGFNTNNPAHNSKSELIFDVITQVYRFYYLGM